MKHHKEAPAYLVIESSPEEKSYHLQSESELIHQVDQDLDHSDFQVDDQNGAKGESDVKKTGKSVEGKSRRSKKPRSKNKKKRNTQQKNYQYEGILGSKKVKQNLQSTGGETEMILEQGAGTNTCTSTGISISFKDFETPNPNKQSYSSMKSFQNQKKRQKKAIPWMSKSTKQIQDSMLRFHNQILEFYEYVRPSERQHQFKTEIFNIVKTLINERYPTAQVKVFGSFATQLYLPDGDIDITVVIDQSQFDEQKVYDNLHKVIRKHQGSLFTDVQYIRKSKVPLIKFIHIETEIQFDISVNKMDGVNQIQHVQRMKMHYPEFAPLVFVFKCMLKLRNMSETYTGGIGSFLLFCMILHFLRSTRKKNTYYLMSEHVLKFMEFYGVNGDWERKSVLVSDGSQIPRNKQANQISFISPQDHSHDIGKSAFKIRDTLNVFKNRFRVILSTNFKAKQSILKELVNPAMQQFKYFKYDKHYHQIKQTSQSKQKK